MARLFAAFPWYERQIQIVGLVISTAGLVASAFVTKVSLSGVRFWTKQPQRLRAGIAPHSAALAGPALTAD